MGSLANAFLKIARAFKRNRMHGMDTTDPEQLKRDQKADLVTFPGWIDCATCLNCKYQKRQRCHHPELMVGNRARPVTETQCCSYWDSEGVYRQWQENSET